MGKERKSEKGKKIGGEDRERENVVSFYLKL